MTPVGMTVIFVLTFAVGIGALWVEAFVAAVVFLFVAFMCGSWIIKDIMDAKEREKNSKQR